MTTPGPIIDDAALDRLLALAPVPAMAPDLVDRIVAQAARADRPRTALPPARSPRRRPWARRSVWTGIVAINLILASAVAAAFGGGIISIASITAAARHVVQHIRHHDAPAVHPRVRPRVHHVPGPARRIVDPAIGHAPVARPPAGERFVVAPTIARRFAPLPIRLRRSTPPGWNGTHGDMSPGMLGGSTGIPGDRPPPPGTPGSIHPVRRRGRLPKRQHRFARGDTNPVPVAPTSRGVRGWTVLSVATRSGPRPASGASTAARAAGGRAGGWGRAQEQGDLVADHGIRAGSERTNGRRSRDRRPFVQMVGISRGGRYGSPCCSHSPAGSARAGRRG